MAGLRKQRQWTAKPPLGPLNPVRRSGLLLACLLSEQSGSRTYDAVSGKSYEFTGGGWESGEFSLRKATGRFTITGLPCQINANNKWSLVVRARGQSQAGNPAAAPIISTNYDAGVNYWGIAINQYTSNLFFRGRFNSYGDFAGGNHLNGGMFNDGQMETFILTVNGYVATIYRENGNIISATLGASSDVTSTSIIVGNTPANTQYRRSIDLIQFYNRALTPAEAAAIIADPWQDVAARALPLSISGGSTTYTEPLTALAESYATVTDIAAYLAAGEAIITAGVSAADTVQMLEGLLTTAESAATATDVAQRAEALLATIQAVDSAQSAATLVEQLIATATGAAEVSDTLTSANTEQVSTTAEAVITVADVAQYREQLLTAAGVSTTVAESAVRADTAQTDVTAAATIQDVITMLEQVYTATTAEAAVTDAVTSGIAESLLTSATAITSAADIQLMVDNLTIMAESRVSLGEIHGYLEQLATAATSGASVTDVLVTAFVGRYIFRDYCSPRSFRDYCSPRSFRDYCSPRGAA